MEPCLKPLSPALTPRAKAVAAMGNDPALVDVNEHALTIARQYGHDARAVSELSVGVQHNALGWAVALRRYHALMVASEIEVYEEAAREDLSYDEAYYRIVQERTQKEVDIQCRKLLSAMADFEDALRRLKAPAVQSPQ